MRQYCQALHLKKKNVLRLTEENTSLLNQIHSFITSYQKDESFGRALSTKHRTKYLSSSDRELPRDMFRFKTVWNYLG